MSENKLIPTQDEIDIYTHISKQATESKFFDKIGREGGLLSIMLFAREIGVPPMSALFGGVNSIQGKIEITPRLMNTMIRKAGHRLEILESSDLVCRIKGIRHDTKEEYTASYTLEEAKRAGLVRSGGGWEKYASDMLFARCISRLGRRLFADVISTSYVQGEIEPDDHSPAPKKEEIVVEATVAEKETLTAEPSSETMDEESLAKIEELIGEDMELLNRILEGYKVDRLSKIPQHRYKTIVNAIQKRKTPQN